jgi:RES domain-containing protein
VTPLAAGFPVLLWPRGQPLWRIHRAVHGPWWFSYDGTGRLDPVHVAGLGACYLAEESIGAWVEVFRTRMLLDSDDIDNRRLTRIEFRREVRLADACDRRALRYGITAQVGADGDYTVPQRFASDAAESGLDGVRWWVRHDPAQQLGGIALFGPAGAPAPRARRWPKGKTAAIEESLIEPARLEFGYRVLPRP